MEILTGNPKFKIDNNILYVLYQYVCDDPSEWKGLKQRYSHLLIPSGIIDLSTKSTTEKLCFYSISTCIFIYTLFLKPLIIVSTSYPWRTILCLSTCTVNPYFCFCFCRTFISNENIVNCRDTKLGDFAVYLVGKSIYLVHDQSKVQRCLQLQRVHNPRNHVVVAQELC